ncbi:hypothetical protein IU821_004030 [Salmonella enterica]|nr:hypothetical protein [Salmonella enterica]
MNRPTHRLLLIHASSLTISLYAGAAHADGHYLLYHTAPDALNATGDVVAACLTTSKATTSSDCIPALDSNVDLGSDWVLHIQQKMQIGYFGGNWNDMPFSNGVWTAPATSGAGANQLRASLQLTYAHVGTGDPTHYLWWCAKTDNPNRPAGWTCKQIMGAGFDIPSPVIPASCTVMNDTTLDLGTLAQGVPLSKEKKVTIKLNCNMDTTIRVQYMCDDPTSDYCIIKSMPGVTHTVNLSRPYSITGAAKNGDKISMTSGDDHLIITDTYTGTPSVSGAYRGSGLIQTTYE